jgi:thiosulfate reductase cytochrome b subunit
MIRSTVVLLLALLAAVSALASATTPAAASALASTTTPAAASAPTSAPTPTPEVTAVSASPAPMGLQRSQGPQSNPMHPAFVVLDETGAPAMASVRPASSETTCGACHDATYIHAHSDHWNDRVRATCIECHFEGGQIPRDPATYDEAGKMRREAIRISAPRNENCASCHGIIHEGQDPLSIPSDFGPRIDPASRKTYDLTLKTGAIISAQDVAGSYLNLRAKAGRDYPWDVHARRLVACVDCHYAPNNPAKGEVKQMKLSFLVEDPRRIPISKFLHEPDHRLAAAPCESCHDPLKVHDFLPYKKRHFAALECQACHVPRLMGPAAGTIDETVITVDRQPLVQYRGVERRHGESFNAAYAEGYSPILLPHRAPDGTTKLAPFNAIDTWFWADGPNGSALQTDVIVEAYLDGDSYLPQVLATFDADRDGRLSPAELRLDTTDKSDLVRSRLRALGVNDPRIRREVSFHSIAHGVQAGEQVQRDCAACHERQSRLNAGLALASYTPAGADPSSLSPPIDPGMGVQVEVGMDSQVEAGMGAQVEASGGARSSVVPKVSASLYVLGHSRRGWTDRLGFFIFIVTILGIGAHTLFRFLSRPARGARVRSATQRVYLYSAYERLWHWLMGFSILVLMATGLQIHFLGAWNLIALPKAVAVHNFFAVVLTVNAVLSLFYHLTTSAIRQFLPPKKGLIDNVAAQAHYYARGIFLGQPHPSPKTPERKLNPLQQLTYLALLNVLFPLQVVTGVLIWGASRWPHLAQATGGLTLAAPLHSLCAWFFLAFFFLHVYLTTTGHTVLSNVSAMIHGYDEIELKRHTATGGSNA